MRLPNKLGSAKALKNRKRVRVNGRTYWWSPMREGMWRSKYARRTLWGSIYREEPNGTLVYFGYVMHGRKTIKQEILDRLNAPSKTKGVLP